MMADTTLTVRTRQQIPAEHTWNSPSLFPNDAAWDAECKKLADDLAALDKYRGHLVEGPQMLVDAFDTIDKLQGRAGKILIYAQMTYSCDTTNQAAASMDSRAAALFGRMLAAMSFVDPELLAIGQDTLNKW